MSITTLLAVYGSITATSSFLWNVFQYYDKKGKIKVVENVMIAGDFKKHLRATIINLTERKWFFERIYIVIRRADSYDSGKYDKNKFLALCVRLMRKGKPIHHYYKWEQLNETVVDISPNTPFYVNVPSDYLAQLLDYEPSKFYIHFVCVDITNKTFKSKETDFYPPGKNDTLLMRAFSFL